MASTGLLDKGQHVYMDNYYTSTDLFEELHFQNTFACGTINPIHKNLPQVVVSKNMKKNPKGDCILRQKGAVLCFRWKEKKPVTMLMTIHEAVMVEMGKVEREGKKIEKPKAVYYYCGRMGGTDLNDQLLNYYTFL